MLPVTSQSKLRGVLMLLTAALANTATVSVAQDRQQDRQPHNLVLFVADGLRAGSVTPGSAPTFAAVRDQGVNFVNPHSVFPTLTMANASGMSTGHFLGDTGIFSNTIYAAYPVVPAGNTVTPFLENNQVLGDLDEHFSGNFLGEDPILSAANRRGLSTAVVGKLGPALVFAHTQRSGRRTVVIDDATGSPGGIPLSREVTDRLVAAGLPLTAPPRGDNGRVGDFRTPGTQVANLDQQRYFSDVAAKVVLPLFKENGRPFVLVFWSRDPDGTQHNQGDSLNALMPGINGPTSLAAVRNADDSLRRLRDALDELGLSATTDVIVTADHGFSTISKESQTSAAARGTYADVPKGMLPPGFLALDLARALGLPLYDPDSKNDRVGENAYPRNGNGVISADPGKPLAVVAANGNSDLVYLPGRDRALAAKVVSMLLEQDYVSGLFVDDDLGPIPGTLPLSAISLKGAALTPVPAIAVNFRSFSSGCDQPVMCTVSVADTRLQQGQGMHGSLNRADTMNFMAAAGPDFRRGFIDEAPVSNVDVGRTIAHVLGLDIGSRGRLTGRVAREALPGGEAPAVASTTLRSSPGANGLQTILVFQQVGATRYFDVAGFRGRTVGLALQGAGEPRP